MDLAPSEVITDLDLVNIMNPKYYIRQRKKLHLKASQGGDRGDRMSFF